MSCALKIPALFFNRKCKIYIYTVEYYSAMIKKETWMNVEGVTLSEISQTEKDKCT